MNNEKDKRQEEFIELRAKGISYDSIAKQLQVSKPTLISWSKQFQTDIHNLREIHKESLREQFAISKLHRLEVLSESLGKARRELSNRDLSEVPTQQLLSFILKAEGLLAQEDETMIFIQEHDGFVLDMTNKETWEG